jgi:predicted NAD/FAD-binding protein
MRIAVIGSGISGMVAAYLLHREHDVTVFEANDYVGGHTHTVDVVLDGKTLPVDTGFIVFNERTYPNFVKLLRTLKVLLRPTFWRMIREIFIFRRQLLETAELPETVTLGQHLRERGYSRAFVERFIVPMGAAIWSAEPRRFEAMPVCMFARFFANHGFLNVRDQPQWLVIKRGSREYAKVLTTPFQDRIRLNCPVRSVRRLSDAVEVEGPDARAERFDHVVIAVHSDQALRLLSDPSQKERELLGAIPYQDNQVVLHTDTSVLPKRRKVWASWNYHIPREPHETVALTYDMNILQSLKADREFCVTLNPTRRIEAEKTIRQLVYAHPVYTPQVLVAQQRHAEISGVNRIHYCGAYWGNGFHEDGVNSALAVCRHFDKGLGDA